MDKATIRWVSKRLLVGNDESGHGVVMDAKAEYGGEGNGIRPVELVLHGLAGCTAMDVLSILEKKRQDVRDVEIKVTGHQRTDEYPKIYERIEVEYIVTGFGIQEAAVARAIELSEEKYCSVKGMLRDDIEFVTSFSVIESPAAGFSVLDAAKEGSS